MSSVPSSELVNAISPERIEPNPENPRRFFNEESLDLLRTSIQEIGILVPLIAYEDPEEPGTFVLLDGERRLICARKLGLESVPVNVIAPPSSLENLLRMFNIHAVREEWPLISIAMSLQEIIRLSGEERETRLSELTGLPRGTVRRAKRLLDLPLQELALIREEAHLPRTQQVHREDLYLEIADAEGAIRRDLPKLAKEYPRETVIRQFARKREEGSKWGSVTDYRAIPTLLRSMREGHVSKDRAERTIRRIIENVNVNPKAAVDQVAGDAFALADVSRKSEALLSTLVGLKSVESADVRALLEEIVEQVKRLLAT